MEERINFGEQNIILHFSVWLQSRSGLEHVMRHTKKSCIGKKELELSYNFSFYVF